MAYPYYNTNPYYMQPNFYPNNNPTPDMLNQFKSYQQPIQQVPQMQQPAQNANNDIIWVQGEAGAKAYLVAPNNTVTLWDSESQTIYLKSADMNGVPSMKILDFTERTETAPKTPTEHACQCGSKFTLKEDFNALQSRFDGFSLKLEELEEKIENLSIKSTPKTTKNTKSEE